MSSLDDTRPRSGAAMHSSFVKRRAKFFYEVTDLSCPSLGLVSPFSLSLSFTLYLPSLIDLVPLSFYLSLSCFSPLLLSLPVAFSRSPFIFFNHTCHLLFLTNVISIPVQNHLDFLS